MLLAKLRDGAAAGTARMALEMATLGGAACLGRSDELGVLSVGAVGDVAVWPLTGPVYAGVVGDSIEGWLRAAPLRPPHRRARPSDRARRIARPPSGRGPTARHAGAAARFQSL